ncbi:MAG: metal-dependent hydrolase [Halobacteriota archaeon]
MPSTLVHVAIAGLVGTALLRDEFDARSIAVVVAVAVVPDLDAFVGLVVPGAHRALFHTLLLPGLIGTALLYDTRVSARSVLRARWGTRGVRIAWVTLTGLLFGAILPDMFTNGVNAFYPLWDTFYTVNGQLVVSNQRGFVQTFVDLTPAAPAHTTQTIHYSTGVDPTPGSEATDVERVFPVATSGMHLLLVLTATVVVGARLWETRGES